MPVFGNLLRAGLAGLVTGVTALFYGAPPSAAAVDAGTPPADSGFAVFVAQDAGVFQSSSSWAGGSAAVVQPAGEGASPGSPAAAAAGQQLAQGAAQGLQVAVEVPDEAALLANVDANQAGIDENDGAEGEAATLPETPMTTPTIIDDDEANLQADAPAAALPADTADDAEQDGDQEDVSAATAGVVTIDDCIMPGVVTTTATASNPGGNDANEFSIQAYRPHTKEASSSDFQINTDAMAAASALVERYVQIAGNALQQVDDLQVQLVNLLQEKGDLLVEVQHQHNLLGEEQLYRQQEQHGVQTLLSCQLVDPVAAYAESLLQRMGLKLKALFRQPVNVAAAFPAVIDINCLGAGGQGSVYASADLAIDAQYGGPVVIKIMPLNAVTNHHALEMAATEIALGMGVLAQGGPHVAATAALDYMFSAHTYCLTTGAMCSPRSWWSTHSWRGHWE